MVVGLGVTVGESAERVGESTDVDLGFGVDFDGTGLGAEMGAGAGVGHGVGTDVGVERSVRGELGRGVGTGVEVGLGSHELAKSLGKLTSLQNLFFPKNQLISRPDSIGNLSGLEVLVFSSDQLTSLPLIRPSPD
jgi:hypothetical protein